MAKGPGGTRVGGANIGATESGYSPAMAKSVVNIENGIRGNDFETLYAFDDNGNVIYSKTGGKNFVKYNGSKTVNSVVTHNHPSGAAFSLADLKGAVKLNQKEIRAVGKEYTYSMKRPAKGWGKSLISISRKFNTYQKEASLQYFKTKTGNPESDRRLWIKLTSNTSAKVAKDFGWNFSVKKNQ